MAQSYNSKLANDMAEQDNVADGLTDDELATLFPEKLTTVSAELQKLIEKRNKDPKLNCVYPSTVGVIKPAAINDAIIKGFQNLGKNLTESSVSK